MTQDFIELIEEGRLMLIGLNTIKNISHYVRIDIPVSCLMMMSRLTLRHYMQWYRSLTSLYLLKMRSNPLDIYYPSAPVELAYVEHILEPFFGRDEDGDLQQPVNKFEIICRDMRKNIYICDTRCSDSVEQVIHDNADHCDTTEDPTEGQGLPT